MRRLGPSQPLLRRAVARLLSAAILLSSFGPESARAAAAEFAAPRIETVTGAKTLTAPPKAIDPSALTPAAPAAGLETAAPSIETAAGPASAAVPAAEIAKPEMGPAAEAAPEAQAPLETKIEKALKRGRFDNIVSFDHEILPQTKAVDGAEPVPAQERVTELKKYAVGYGRGLLKKRTKAREPVYYQTTSGLLVPVAGDFGEYVKAAQLTLYKAKTNSSEAAYVVAPAGRSKLKTYEPELAELAAQAMTQGAKLSQALDLIGGARRRGQKKDVTDSLKRLQDQLAQYVASRDKWLARVNKLTGGARQEDMPFLTAVLEGADFRTGQASLSIAGLISKRFADADELLAALYPEHIKDLRHFIPNLQKLGVADLQNSIFIDRELTRAFIANRKSRKAEEPAAVGALSQVQFKYSSDDVGGLLTRLGGEDNPTLAALAPELREVIAEGAGQAIVISQAMDRFDAALRSRESGKDLGKALTEANAKLAEYVAARNSWKVKRDALIAKVPAGIQLFMKAVADAVDYKKTHANLNLAAVLAERYPNADLLLAALYPDSIEKLRVYIPNLASLNVGDFQNSLFMRPDLVREFVENRKTFSKEQIQPARSLSRILFTFTIKDVGAAVERLAKSEDPELKAVMPDLQKLAAEAVPFHAKWDAALDRFERAVKQGRSSGVKAALADISTLIAERGTDATAWNEKLTALYPKTSDQAVRYFLQAATNALNPHQTNFASLLSTRFRNADELLSALYPKDIEELRRTIPNLASLAVTDFESSLFTDPEVTREFVASRRDLKPEQLAAVSALSRAVFQYKTADVPKVLAKLRRRKTGALKDFEPELRSLAGESLPMMERLNAALDGFETAVKDGKDPSPVAASLAEVTKLIAERREDATKWSQRAAALQGKADTSATKAFVGSLLFAINPMNVSFDSLLAQRFGTADGLLERLYPDRIAELRKYMPSLAQMQVKGFENSIFVDKRQVLSFLENRGRLAEMGLDPQAASPTSLLDVRFAVPASGDRLRPKFQTGDFRLPYKVDGVKNLKPYSDPSDPGYAIFKPDATTGAAKAQLQERFRIFSDLIEANFRVLPMISKFSAEPMPKSAARAIVAEVGSMVAHYETLARSAGKEADGKAVRAKFDALSSEMEKLWKDLPETAILPEETASRVASIEEGVDLPAIKNFHTLVNFIHQRSFQALSALDANKAGQGQGSIKLRNDIPFTDLGDEPLVQNNKLTSKPLLALLDRDARPGGHQTDTVIIRGDEAWVHAHLGLHSAEIYVNFADPDDGGMLRIRYQEGTNTPVGNPARLALVREEHTRLGIHTEVEDPRPEAERKNPTKSGLQPLHLVSIIDKDHGLTSAKQLAKLFSFTLQGLHDTLDMNCAFNPLGKEKCDEVVPMLADVYMAEGRWAQGWNKGGNYFDFHKQYMDRKAEREGVRKALNKELVRLGLTEIPKDVVFGQVAVEKHFTTPIQQALLRGEIKWDADGVPQPQEYRPVESLSAEVMRGPAAAEAVASVLGHFESELDYEPIGVVGAMRAERATWQFSDSALVLYGLREPETGTLGFATAYMHQPAKGLTPLSSEELAKFLNEEGVKAPAADSLSTAQREMLLSLLRAPLSESPLSGRRVDGLAASAGQGGFVTAPVTFDRAGKAGGVLMVPYTNPDDIDAIKKSAAVVTTGGGLLSHAAITTRELGLASVILPRAEWKKNGEDGKPSLDITMYEPEGAAVTAEGLHISPRLRPVSLRIKEGDLVRVNGATGEFFLFPKSEPRANLQAVRFALEEALFNPKKRETREKIVSKLLHNDSEEIRQTARTHAKSLFDHELHKAAAPHASEASAAALAAFHKEIAALEELASLLAIDAGALTPLKTAEEGLKKAAASRQEEKLAAVRAEINRLRKEKAPEVELLPAVRREIRLLESLGRSAGGPKSIGTAKWFEARETEKKIEEARKNPPAVMPLSSVDDDYKFLVGGKLSKLGEIETVVRKAGGYVPSALAATTEAYKRFLRENNLETRLDVLAVRLDRVLATSGSEKKRQELVEKISKQIRGLLLTGKLDPKSGVGKEIWDGMVAQGLAAEGKQLAIRSSAVQEDTADAAFAGAAESYLHVKPDEALHKIIENWTSFWLPRGIVYRHEQNIPSTALLASTIVQEMAQADVAGVLFTQNPVSGRDEIVINAAYGLGEGIVSGIVQTDRYTARKSDGQEASLPFIGDKRVAVMPKGSGSGTELRGVSGERRKLRALTIEQTRRLSLIAKALEEHFGYPLDIEFAIAGDRVAILQARPVTVRGTTPKTEEKKAPSPAEVKPVVPEKKRIVFVCAGNACRSPMAEFFAKDMLAKEGNADVEVFSRGVHARDGGYMSSDSFYHLKDKGIDGTAHRSHKLAADDVSRGDIILAMDQSNVDDILKKFPQAGGKTYLLKEFARTGTGDVDNPWPAIGRAYNEAANEILTAVDAVVKEVKAGTKPLRSIVFACSYNTSRSPMAEYLAKEELANAGLPGVKVISRSVYPKAKTGYGMNPAAVALLQSVEIDASRHVSKPLTEQEVAGADVILAMEENNVSDILSKYPQARGKVHLLKEYARTGMGDIENPSRKIYAAYTKAGNEIQDAVRGTLDRVKTPEPHAPDESHIKKRVAFVCSGNECSSPMAEYFAKDFLAKEGRSDVQVFSRGVSSYGGSSYFGGSSSSYRKGMSDRALAALKKQGIDGAAHRSQNITAADVAKSDVILAMTEKDLDNVLDKYPEAESKTFLLKDFAQTGTGDIEEPGWGSSARAAYDAYEEAATEIIAAIKAVTRDVKSAAKPLKSIMFACTFNTSRSPMAEYFAKDELKREGLGGVKVFSRSISSWGGGGSSYSLWSGGSSRAFPGTGISVHYSDDGEDDLPAYKPSADYRPKMKDEALNALAERGVEGGDAHRSTPMTAEDVAAADAILAMGQDNVDDILKKFPEAKGKVHLLKEYAGTGTGDVENPSKTRERHAYNRVSAEIRDAVKAAIAGGFTAPARLTLAAVETKKLVLFICDANHSRSPLAERLLRDRLHKARIDDYEVGSRGLGAWSGGTMNSLSADVLNERGIKFDPHKSRGISRRDVRRAAVLLVMLQRQKDELERRYPEARGKVFLLTEYGGRQGEIIDHPHNIDVFRHIRGQMEDSMDGIIAKLKK